MIFFSWFCITAETKGSKVINYLILNDFRSALAEGKQQVIVNPDSQKYWQDYIQALAASGESTTCFASLGRVD